MTTVATTPEVLTVKEISERLGVTEHCVLAWINSKQLPAINTARDPRGSKPRWRIRVSDLEAFEQRRLTTPPAPRRRRRQEAHEGYKKYPE